jgi:hypothetical protein
MTDGRPSRWLTLFTLGVYWTCLVIGLAIPWLATIVVDMLKHDQSLSQATHQLRLHLFAPGYNLYLVALFNAVPFVLFAVFTLFHMGRAPLHDRWLVGRRGAGILMAAIALVMVSAWTHAMTLWHPDAQGAIAYLFLPFVLLAVAPVAYAVGRVLATFIFR